MIALNPWPEDRVIELKRLFDAGLSAAQIAAALGDPTRNSVIGKIHRMKWTRDTKSVRVNAPRAPRAPRKAAQPRPRKPTNHYATRWGAYSAETKAGELPAPRVLDLTPLNVSFADIGAFQCRWIVSEQPVLFCGHSAFLGSWCPTHRAVVFTPRTADRKMGAVAP